jgi:hypothetical protein
MKSEVDIYGDLKKQFKDNKEEGKKQEFAKQMFPLYQRVVDDEELQWTVYQQHAINHLKLIADFIRPEDIVSLAESSIETFSVLLMKTPPKRVDAKIANEVKCQTVAVIMNLARLVSSTRLQ